MVQLISIWVFTFFIATTCAAASSENYNPVFYGEKNFDIYYGPLTPDFKHDQYTGQVIWYDDLYHKDYIAGLVQNNFSELEDFFERKLHKVMICSNQSIGNKLDYLRFINRLVSMSYLFESLRNHHQLARQLSFGKTCQINWRDTIKKCQGKSSDMQLFLNNVNIVIDKMKPVLISADFSMKKFKQQWINQFNSNDFKDVTHYRLHQSCKNCQGLTNNKVGNEKLNKALQNVCDEELHLFQQLCSEKDHIYGMSQIPQAYSLLVKSEILNAINEDEQARGCLRRFNQQFASKEFHSSILATIFPILYTQLQARVYPQGALFAAGSMREFHDKGLVAVFESDKEKTLKDSGVKSKVTPVKPDKKIEKVAKKRVSSAPQIKSRTKPKPKKSQPKVFKSSFLIASEFRKRYDIQLAKVDMLKFKYDYIFPIKILKVMQKSMSKFMSKKSLEEMKKYDSLGSKEGPVPLTFIKYMIDQKQHQGLYNLIDVLGESFYVKNNIDKAVVSANELVRLKNDASTDYQWQLYVLKE